jgi:nitroreductase
MNVIDALNSRFAVRAFEPDPVHTETILTILDAATRAPSSGNTQPWGLFVAGGDALDRLRHVYDNRFKKGAPGSPDLPAPQQWPPAQQKRMDELRAAGFESLGIGRDDTAARHAMFERAHQFFGAPTVVYLCMDRTLTAWSIFDMGLLAQSIMLAAQQYGVDSAAAALLISYPDLIRAELEIPEDVSILMGVALGYRDRQHPLNQYRSPRRPLKEVVRLKGLT